MRKKDQTMKLHATANNLPAQTRERSVQVLNQALADLSDLYSQAKQAHWNVRGPKFMMLHELFDRVAGMVEEHLDAIAERVTALGGTAAGTVRMAAAASALPEWPANLTSEDQFTRALTERFAKAANAVRAGIDTTAQAGDADTADLLTTVSLDLDKALWFLEASA
jgi:starvation-inducible DNA-binding protein